MPRAGLTADRLAAAAADLADEAGFAGVTVAAVARGFGVRPASLYSHLRSTDELRVRVSALALDELATRGADAVAGRSGREALIAYADAYRDYARAHPGRHAALTHPVGDDPVAAEAGLRNARLLRAVLHGYRLAEPAQTHAVRLLGSTVRGFVELEGAGGFDRSRPSAAASWKQTLIALDALFSAWPG